MEKKDYDTLSRHLTLLRNSIKILENMDQFGSVAEMEMVHSVIQQLRVAALETSSALEKIEARRRKVSEMRRRVDRIIKMLPIPTIVLVAFFGIYKNGQGVLLISFFAILLLLILTLLKNVAVTITEVIAVIAIGVIFTIVIGVSETIQGFVITYSAEIGAISLLYALILPWFTKRAESAHR